MPPPGILRIEWENFKSYKGHQVIGPFFNFTAIIGPNGAGKSNLMDAINFVLGVRTGQLRGAQLEDLIYTFDLREQEQRGRRAYVKLVYLLESGSEIAFTRTITGSGGSEYRVDNRVVNWDQYNEKLRELGVLVKARNFLVFQGDVESIASKNPKELTVLFEQISGSEEHKRDYEDFEKQKARAEEETALIYQRQKTVVAERKQKKEQKEKAEKHLRLQEKLTQLQMASSLSSNKEHASDSTKTPPQKGMSKALDDFIAASLPSYTPFSELNPGMDCTVKAMVTRKWDAITLSKHYFSTDYILTDHTGGAIHCVARANISHCFVGKLLVGEIYAISKFTVAPPKATYRLRNGDPFVIQLEGITIVRRLDCPAKGFDKHPLQLVPLQDIKFNDSKFLIDIVGCPINIGTVQTTPTGAQLLEFHLMNERGNMIKVSMWGSMGEDLIQRNNGANTPFIVVLASMNVRHWNGDIYLSTTSATTLYDTKDIPAIKQLQLQMSTASLPTTLPPLPTITARQGTLSELLMLGREHKAFPRKDSTTFHIEAKINRVLPENSWNYLSCGGRNCRKGLTPIGGQFYCASCYKTEEFPLVRYKLNLEISDHTATLPITVFDDLAETLLKKKAATLLKEVSDNPEECVLPQEIKQLSNTYHVFEVKTHTYFAIANDKEKFTVSRIVSSRPVLKEKAGESGLSTMPLLANAEELLAGANVVDIDGSEQKDKHDAANEVTPIMKAPNKTHSKKRKAVILSSDDETGSDDDSVGSVEHATRG